MKKETTSATITTTTFKKEQYLKLYSNEIVFRGHPDKVCDQIAGAILDAYMSKDNNTRAGIEVCGGKGKIFITGEITSKAKIKNCEIKKITKRVMKDIGYKPTQKIIVNFSKQSPDIARGVDNGGAGDQGMMFGYACNDTGELLPTAMVILQRFAEFYDTLVHSRPSNFKPDGKAQITGYYDNKWNLVKIKTFLVSYQTPNDEWSRSIADDIIKEKIINLCKKDFDIEVENILINPTGAFEIGGFDGDAGLTGRKIVVDAYQSFANVGGGNMNGKDPSKVDFSATHKARELAVRFLKKYHLKWCEVQLSYAIGKAEPLAIYIRSDIGNIKPNTKLYEECKPQNIRKWLHLDNAPFEKLARYGHFRSTCTDMNDIKRLF